MSKEKRQLWQCLHAKVRLPEVVCELGHTLNTIRASGNVNIERVYRGEPLYLASCQDCTDYEEMGPPLEKEDRGWKPQ